MGKNFGLFAAIFCAWSLMAVPTSAETSKEQMVKAAIVFNLARFIEWPEGVSGTSHGEFHICLMHNNNLVESLNIFSGKVIQDRVVKIVAFDGAFTSLADCQIFFFSKSASNFENVREQSLEGVLTIGDGAEFTDRGGGIALFQKNGKIKFTINQQVLEAAKLTPSSKILSLSSKGK